MKYAADLNILDVPVECLINPVNCQAHVLEDMKKPLKGLALAYHKAFPGTQESYVKVCRDGDMKPGSIYFIPIDRSSGAFQRGSDFSICNFATKGRWGDPAKIEWIRLGLAKLAYQMRARDIRSVAIPMIGSGFGKLDWRDVQREIHDILSPLSAEGREIFVVGPDALGLTGTVTQSFTYAGIGSRDTGPAWSKPVVDGNLRVKAAIKADAKMVEIGMLMAVRGGILRSGAADGSDTNFEVGCDALFGAKEIYLPYNGFNDRKADGKSVLIEPVKGPHQIELIKKYHTGYDYMGKFGQQAMLRNALQQFGRNLDDPVGIVILHQASKNPKKQGGTGQGMRMARGEGIPLIDLNDDPWLEMSAPEIVEIAIRVARKETTLEAELSALDPAPRLI